MYYLILNYMHKLVSGQNRDIKNIKINPLKNAMR